LYSFSEKNFLGFQNPQGFSILQTEKIEKEYNFFGKAKMILVLFLGIVLKRWLMRGFETLAIQYLACDSRKKVLLFSTNDRT